MAKLKAGMDQVTAWIAGTLMSGLLFGGLYLVVKMSNGHADGTGEEHAAAHGDEHEEHAAKPTEEHGNEHSKEYGDEHKDEHKKAEESSESAHGDEHAAEAVKAKDHEPKAKSEKASGHGDSQKDSHKKEQHEDAHKDKHHSQNEPAPAVGAAVAWDYNGSTGPDHWGDLDPSFSLCKTGKQQSPINIEAARADHKALPLRFAYKTANIRLRHTGRSMEADAERGSSVELDGDRFDLVQLQWHVPSEHKVSGLGYDMELQLTHKNAEGKLAIISVLYEEGAENKPLAPLWTQLPIEEKQVGAPLPLDPLTLLPKSRLYYRYQGSLTTPPCSEDVSWYVLAQSQPVSSQQVDLLQSLTKFSARPVRALGKRSVTKSLR